MVSCPCLVAGKMYTIRNFAIMFDEWEIKTFGSVW